MDDRLSHLLTRLRERFPGGAEVSEVEAFLSSEGYDRREIGEIMLAWLTDNSLHAEPRPASVKSSSIPFRVLGPHERGRFTTEAWGHLLSLSHAGLVTATELEGVIDRALSQLEGRIALDDLRALMESGGPDELGPPPDHVTIH
ncbi:MAG: DUF494 family protein [Gemmatimonadaceae bacterium]|nr:DUF494 family protein [Gemmatimonadaceae bacterium]